MIKIRALLTVVILVLCASSSKAQLTFWNDLYVYYPFNGSTLDFSGNNLDAIGSNITPAEGFYGDANGSYYFNGTDSKIVRDVLTLTDSTTIAGWYHSEADSQATGLFYNGNSGSNGFGIFVKQPSGTGSGYLGKKLVYVQGGISENTFNDAYDLPKNEWVHLAMVLRGASFQFYINGILQIEGPVNCNPAEGEFSIGASTAHLANGWPSFKGKIDEIMVFRSALTAQNVFKVYQSNLTAEKPVLSTGIQISVSPNPSDNGIISIDCGKLKIKSVEFFDLKGASVKTMVHNGSQYDVSGLYPGLYTAVVRTDGRTFSHRIALK